MNKHKGVKVYWNGLPLRDIYPHATKWQIFKYRVRIFCLRLVIVSILVGSIVGAFKLGGIMNPATIYTKAEVIKEVSPITPIMDRIAGCESEGNPKSKGSHYDKNGQVRMNSNTNRSVDIGKFQINNQAWGKKATELGYNLVVEKDNEEMAKWIYQNRGTEDWYSSKKCWQS